MTKNCPSCAEEVPVDAARCKHCFHNFNEEVVEKKSPLMGLLVLLLAMFVVGMGAFGYIYYFNEAEKIVIDEETQSVVITRVSASKTTTDRIKFADIVKVEHIMGGESATFETLVILTSGERVVLNQSSEGTLKAEVRGEVVTEDRVLVLRHIHVRYRLEAGAADRDAIERAYASHHRYCPIYRSIEAAINVTTELEII